MPPVALCVFGVANDRHKKATIKWLVFNVWPSVVIVAFLYAAILPVSHTQTLHHFARVVNPDNRG